MKNTSAISIKKHFLRWLPIIILIILLVLFFSLGWNEYIGFSSLKEHRGTLLAWTANHYFIVVLSFIAIYTLAVAVSIPGAIFFTLAGGFLFGVLWGTLYVIISATLGATLLFFAVKSALGGWLREKASAKIELMRQGFQKNAFTYLFILRLIPLFPFWLVNIVPALLGVPLRTFVLATFLGIIPGSFVYVTVGNGLGAFFDQNQTPNLGVIFMPAILLPLIGLALLSLLPLLYQKYSKKRDSKKN